MTDERMRPFNFVNGNERDALLLLTHMDNVLLSMERDEEVETAIPVQTNHWL
jgi:hypothetical protein